MAHIRRSAPRAARESNGSARGRRQRAQRCPPPPPPRAVDSRPYESSLAKLVVDLAPEAVTEREVDESEHRDEQRQGESRDLERQEQDARNGEEDPAEALSEVVRLRTVLNRARLDDAARLQDLEVELLEQRELRNERAQQQHDCEQRDEQLQRPVEDATYERDQHRDDDARLVHLERRMIDCLQGGRHDYFSMGTRIELP